LLWLFLFGDGRFCNTRHRDGDQNKTVAVLEIPPVDSPQSAVKVAIASKARQ
jgi:hypothetical protein